jgi:glycosyltransferase involved in cell wall biosynthesis
MFPGEEDFGIAPIQAMAAGRPVIAFDAGGARDTVVPGTGRLFKEQSVDAIVAAVESFDTDAIDVDFIQAHARNFDVKLFKQQMEDFISRRLDERQRAGQKQIQPALSQQRSGG